MPEIVVLKYIRSLYGSAIVAFMPNPLLKKAWQGIVHKKTLNLR
ncbi:MAG: hypothetical protein ACI9CP_000427 [Cryomorphaceae bacterium]|jgi:hypothetical protein